MTNITPGSRRIMYDWLLNTLTTSLESSQKRVALWKERRRIAVELFEAENVESPDLSELDHFRQIILANDGFETATVLVRNLLNCVRSNPLGGQRLTVLETAVRLMPEARVCFGISASSSQSREVILEELYGRSAWVRIFQEKDFRFPKNFMVERVEFPEIEEYDVEELEMGLFSMVREEGFVMAAKIPEAFKMEATGKVYAKVRRELIDRGWVWKSKKIGGKVVKVVFPPKVTEFRQI